MGSGFHNFNFYVNWRQALTVLSEKLALFNYPGFLKIRLDSSFLIYSNYKSYKTYESLTPKEK